MNNIALPDTCSQLNKRKWIEKNIVALEDFYDYYRYLVTNNALSDANFFNYVWLCEKKNVYLPHVEIDSSRYQILSHIYFQLESYVRDKSLLFLSGHLSRRIFIICGQQKEDYNEDNLDEYYTPNSYNDDFYSDEDDSNSIITYAERE